MRLAILIALLTSLTASAAPRVWKNKDATQSVRGDFLSRDNTSVLIRRSSDLKQIRLPLNQMHVNDVAWVKKTYPLSKAKEPVLTDSMGLLRSIHGTLRFGDNTSKVTSKIKASGLFDCTMPETMLARTGLNSVFRTKQKILNHHSQLYFGWDADGGLKEFTLHTDSMPLTSAKDQILPCLQSYIDIFTKLYGKPLSSTPTLELNSIQQDAIIFSYLWEPENIGTILVGVSRTEDGYQIAVRFTNESYKSQIKTAPVR